MPRLSLLFGLALVVGCNEAPTASVATIHPTAPTTLEDLELQVGEATDPNRSDSPTQYIRWALNGQDVPSLDDRKVVPSSMTAAGDVWTAKVIATDGELESIPRTVSTTIANTQSYGTVRFSDETPQPGEALEAIATFGDIDDQDIELTWHWALDDRATPYDGPVIPAGITEKGQRWLVSVVGFDGTDVSDAVQREVVIGNAAPALHAVTIGPEDAVAGDDLVATVAAVDTDGDPISFRYYWVVDGEAMDETGGRLDGAALTRDQQVEVWVVATDGTASSPPTRASLIINNTPPSVESAQLSRGRATVQDELSCTAAGIDDADNDDTTTHYYWTVNDDIVSQGAVLDAPVSRGDVVMCSVVVTDDTDASTPAHSHNLTIDNAIPTDSGLAFSTDTPRAGTDLGVAFVDPVDADGDVLTESYAWTVNGKTIKEGTTLGGDEFVRGDLITATAILTDGIDQGDLRTAHVIVRNAQPIVDDVSLSGSGDSGDIGVSVSASDPDHDPLFVSYDWHINGQSAGVTGPTLSGVLTQRGDAVSVQVVVRDNFGSPTTAESGTVLVSNRAPSLASVSIDANSASVGDTLRPVFDPATDPDGDAITYAYAWHIDGSVVSTESSLTVPQGGGEAVTVTVTPSDPFSVGNGVTAAAIPLTNRAPTVTSVSLTPQIGATVSSILSVEWTATDPENDDLVATYTWFTSTGIQPVTGPNFPVSEYSFAGDQVGVVVSVSDGTNPEVDATTESVTIGNTAPEPLELSFEPSILEPNVALKCAVNGLFDADGDDIQVDIAWFADGESFDGGTLDTAYDGDTIPADVVGLFETWECQATASDGTASSTTQGIDDDVTFSTDSITGQYTSNSHVLYRLQAVSFPETDAQSSYAQACMDIGAFPVSCDPNELGAQYDASAYGALAFDTATYGCDISAAVSDLTGWQGLVSFHQPSVDPRGVCEEGCLEESPFAYPLCAVATD